MSYKKLDRDERQDIGIIITNELIKLGYVPDCTDTDDGSEFEVQDLIAKVLKKKCLYKKVLTIDKIISFLSEKNIDVTPYTENDILCGYELNTYTDGGVNEIIFLDFRDKIEPQINANDFIVEFTNYMNSQIIEERIETNRYNEDYKRNFTLKESLKDFSAWEKNIKKIIKKLGSNL